ncbi:MAG: penicillin-binding protein 1A [Alphaproteobacteria bacterium]|nr:MAG: penicillin-binding protein 1A [Alphaproteobacteria bacterium]
MGRDLPDYQVLSEYKPAVTTRVHAGDGSVIAEFARERRVFVPSEAIPDVVIQAFISAEDKNFYHHNGVDLVGIMKAAVANVRLYSQGQRMRGASTITQQVAKNFLLTSERKLDRKVKEAILAFRIEQAFTKDEILELYLNEIYLGLSSYGVAAASLNYYDKSLDELTVEEAAYLAALPKGPANYHPTRRPAAAVERRNWVIGRMEANGYISEEQAELAKATPLKVKPRRRGVQIEDVQYFVEEVRREVYDIYGDKSLYDGGLSVRSTLDTDLQGKAVKALRSGLVAYDQRHGWRGALAKIDFNHPEGLSWQKQIDELTLPTEVDPWRIAVVLSIDEEGASVGFATGGAGGRVPLEEMLWARPWLKGQHLGPEVKKPSDVLHVGDVVFVEPIYLNGPPEPVALAEPVFDEEQDVFDENPETGETKKSFLLLSAVNQPDHYALRQVPNVNGGIVAIDPHTGRVLALSGGFSFDLSQFNRATQAYRQPGSSFKPFVYAAAMDLGYTPSTLVLDAPFVIDQGANQGWWKPENYSDRFYGPSTLRFGIEKSKNVMTVRLAQEIGMEPIVDYAQRFGIRDNMQPVLSMALGAGETSLIRLTTAYAELVNGGKKITPTLIDRIQDRDGITIYRHDKRDCPDCNAEAWDGQHEPQLIDNRAQIIDTRTAYQVVSMLEGVVLRGTGRTIRSVGKPLGGKTGTTNDEKDAWFVGFAPDLAVGVFVGFDSPRAMGRSETGGKVAAPIFRDFMQMAIGDKPAVPFRTPEGIRLVRINRETGLLAKPGDREVILEAFKPGTEPTDVAPEVIGGGAYDPNAAYNPDVDYGEDQPNGNALKSGTGGLY